MSGHRWSARMGRQAATRAPAGTVTLLAAGADVALPDDAVSNVVAGNHGVRQAGEDGSFVAAFRRASDALACALELQRTSGPIRVALHTGEVEMRDDGSYVGPTLNRTVHLRDLGHAGQIVLSGTTSDIAIDRLPADAWFTDLGTHRLPDQPRPERLIQLCHPALRAQFPPLATPSGQEPLSTPLTSFVGRVTEIREVREILARNRLVTLTGAGGVGKTRLAGQVAAQSVGEFCDGVSCVDLAPVIDSQTVPLTILRALGLPDQPGRPIIDTLSTFIGNRRMLLVLDNCEHLLDSCASRVAALLGACPELTLLATSREPIGVAGEVTWRVPSLSLTDEAIELFTDRARRVRPDFALGEHNIAAVTEICRRLDGMPLAIELAAAWVRALSPNEILDGLQDRFRLLTGGARSVVHRHQTLRASVDWSHELLSEPERIVFRRLAVFLGGFELDAAAAVAAAGELGREQVRDYLTMLVDKSLAMAESDGTRTRYRLLETVRAYAMEKLGESGDEHAVRARHRDHYTSLAAGLESPARAGHEQLLEQAETEMDNLRAAFAFSREVGDHDLALQLASSLQPLWLTRGRVSEGSAWFDGVLDQLQPDDVVPAVRARAIADRAVLNASQSLHESADQVQQALTIARQLGDPALLVRALIARGGIASCDAATAGPYFAEAMTIARALGDGFTLVQILAWQAFSAYTAGDPTATRAAAEEGCELADTIGARLHSRLCRWCLGAAQMMSGDVKSAIAQFRMVADEAGAAHDPLLRWCSLVNLGHALAYHGETGPAQATAEAAVEAAAQFGGYSEGYSYATLAIAALAAGDVAAAAQASASALTRLSARQELASYDLNPLAQAALAGGDLPAARRWSEIAMSRTTGWHLAAALTTRARVAVGQADLESAEREARRGLACAAQVQAHLVVPDVLECLAEVAADTGSDLEAARLFGSAHAIRGRTGLMRFRIYDAGYESSVAKVRSALERNEFDRAWEEGTGLSTSEAISYALRGHTGRKRPASGWMSLTPTELDISRLVAEGLTNRDVAARLFVSPRTVQTHLTHIYAKLGVTSRLQLAQEAAGHP